MLLLMTAIACNNDNGVQRPVKNGFSSEKLDIGLGSTGEMDISVINQPGLNRFPAIGELRINEIFFDPNNGLEDLYGEWIEIVNVADDTLSLDDCNLADAAHQDEGPARADLHGIRLARGCTGSKIRRCSPQRRTFSRCHVYIWSWQRRRHRDSAV